MNKTEILSEKIDHFRECCGIPGSVLKYLAVISMLVDHTAATVVRRLYTAASSGSTELLSASFYKSLYFYMRRFGRLAFPIYCFLIVEGITHTKNINKYIGRMFLFAVLSEFPFDFALHHGQPFFTKQNVYFTLLIGLLVLTAVRELRGKVVLQIAVMIFGMLLAKLLKTDYNYKGVFIIEMLYILRSSRIRMCSCGAAFMYYYEKLPTPLAFIPIFFYNGKRGRQLKYFFYFFYPGHLLLLGIITYMVLPRLL